MNQVNNILIFKKRHTYVGRKTDSSLTGVNWHSSLEAHESTLIIAPKDISCYVYIYILNKWTEYFLFATIGKYVQDW